MLKEEPDPVELVVPETVVSADSVPVIAIVVPSLVGPVVTV